jgi:hypothetical protein
MRLGGIILAACLLGWTAFASAESGQRYVRYFGVAKSRHADAFLYGEQHFLVYRDGRLAERAVLYVCRDGSPFARKTVTYTDTYAPDFLLDDQATGMREGIRSLDQQRQVFFRGNRIEPEKSKVLPQTQSLVADAGFDEFIRAHWDMLMTGQALPLQFLVPSRLKAMSFELQRVRSDTLNGMPIEVMRLKLSGILGEVLPGIDVSYSANEHVLARYEGLSDLRDAAGDNFQALITFQPSDRSSDDANGIAAARSAHLAPCK